jgi:hypothetical protein
MHMNTVDAEPYYLHQCAMLPVVEAGRSEKWRSATGVHIKNEHECQVVLPVSKRGGKDARYGANADSGLFRSWMVQRTFTVSPVGKSIHARISASSSVSTLAE